jgi:hypothetical protein
MKRIIILSALIASAFFCEAQTLNDGLIYGRTDDIYGTARFRALSGAFGALGGDLSAISQNPAGSAIFNNHYASFSLANNHRENNTQYLGTSIVADDNDLDFNQLGGVLVFESVNGSALNKFSVGLNYHTTRSYDNNLFIAGTGSSSIGDFFVNNANGFALENFETRSGETVDDLYQFLGEEFGFSAQQGFLGFQSFVIDPVDGGDPNNTQYVSNTGTGNFNQQYEVLSSGNQGKASFNAAMQFDERWSLGINLNSHFIDYSRFTGYSETNSNSDAAVNEIYYDNRLDTEAAGFSFQLGAIGKITESLRVGATYESPTWYDIEERLVQEIFTVQSDGTTTSVAPNVVNFYAPYDLRTPGSLTGSLAYIFGNKGLISFDYTTRDYSQLEFSPENEPTFADNNQLIDQLLTRAATIRIGGEYRIDNFTLRGGYRYQESPYEDTAIEDALEGYSLGLGYTWGSTTLDLSYDHSERDSSQQLFNTGQPTAAFNRLENSNIALTLGFNF